MQERCLAQLSPKLCSEIRRACEKSVADSAASSANVNYVGRKPRLVTTPPPDDLGAPPPQYVFIRADKLDNPYPGLSISAGQALGASISYTNNDFVQTKQTTPKGTVAFSTSQSVMASGLVSFVLTNPETNLGWRIGKLSDQWVYMVPSLWISGNGNWDKPTKAFGDTSAVKAGGELDFLLFPSAIQNDANYWSTYFGVAPFYQTDLYGQASAEGATVSLTPSNHQFFLMGSPPGFSRETGGLFDGFLELRGEATYLDVSRPGATLLHQGSYEWLGGAARSYIFLFPEQGGGPFSSNPYLADRLSLVGTYQYYWDANSHAEAKLFSAALQYKLGGCDTSTLSKCLYGSPSISAQYDVGTDRDTLQNQKKVQVKFNYAW